METDRNTWKLIEIIDYRGAPYSYETLAWPLPCSRKTWVVPSNRETNQKYR